MTDQPKNAPPRPARRWLKRAGATIALLISLGFAFAVGAWLTIGIAVRRSPEILTPNVVGQSSESAEELLRDAGLAPEISARRHDPQAPEGKVLSQMPPPGGSTRPGRPVRLIVSLGSRRSIAPDLVGGSQGRAILALRAAGLIGDVEAQTPDFFAPVGRVLAQHPPAGSEAAPGERVILLLSSGPRIPTYVMPDVVGRPAARIVAALGRCGFRRIRTVGPGGEAQSAGIVKTQDPGPGQPVSLADPIALSTAAE